MKGKISLFAAKVAKRVMRKPEKRFTEGACAQNDKAVSHVKETVAHGCARHAANVVSQTKAERVGKVSGLDVVKVVGLRVDSEQGSNEGRRSGGVKVFGISRVRVMNALSRIERQS